MTGRTSARWNHAGGITMRYLLNALLLWTLALTSVAASPLRQSFDMQVLVPPEPVMVEGKWQLVYELQLTNFAPSALELTQLDILDDDASNVPLASWQGDALASRIAMPGATSGSNPRTIAPGMHAVIYIEIALDPHSTVPHTLQHRITFDIAQPDGHDAGTVQGGEVSINWRQPSELGPPLRGGPWIAIYGPNMPRGHRRVIFAIDGHARIPARFAIDWIKLDSAGNFALGDERQVNHWLGYGQDVLAVADSTVVAVRNDFPESATLSNKKHALENASGNYVSLDLGDGRYAHYEHLKPGSIRVHVGEHVHRGQPIAALGYTGDSTGPHLHFHVSNGSRPLAGEGMPFVFSSFRRLGAYSSIEAFGQGKPWTQSPLLSQQRQQELPAADAVVAFPDTPP